MRNGASVGNPDAHGAFLSAPPEASTHGQPSWLPIFVTLVIILGAGWRLVDLTEWPFPFHPTVQYESALAARAIWLELSPEARTPDRLAWRAETRFLHVVSPPVLPMMVATCYWATGEEIPWISKVFTAAAWLGACLFVGGAVVRQTGCRWSGAIACAWLTFTPYGLMVSRSFQTESFVVFGFALAVWHLSRPGRTLHWRTTVLSAAICGLAGVMKPGVLLPSLTVGFAASLLPHSVAGTFSRKVVHAAAFAILLAVPSVGYVLVWLPHRGAELQPGLLTQPAFYHAVARMIGNVVGFWAFALAAVGMLLAIRRQSYLGLGLGAGYLAYIGFFTYHCSTHDYYHTPLLVIVALGLGWLGAALIRQVRAVARGRWSEAVLALAITLGLAVYLYAARLPFVGPWRLSPWMQKILLENTAKERERTEAYSSLRGVVGPHIRVITVSEEYGYPLEYVAWLRVSPWPRLSDSSAPGQTNERSEDRLRSVTAMGFRFLIVTDFAEFDAQPDLQAAVERQGRLVISSPRLRVYDLRP